MRRSVFLWSVSPFKSSVQWRSLVKPMKPEWFTYLGSLWWTVCRRVLCSLGPPLIIFERLSYCMECQCGRGTINSGYQLVVPFFHGSDLQASRVKYFTLCSQQTPKKAQWSDIQNTSLQWFICQKLSELTRCYNSLEWESVPVHLICLSRSLKYSLHGKKTCWVSQ